MSVQRARRASEAILYPIHAVKNNRGDDVWVPDMDNGVSVNATFSYDRSSRAEVPGRVENVTGFLLFDFPTEPLIDSVVEWNGDIWDVYQPAAFRDSETPRLKHWTVPVRRRPRGRDAWAEGGG